MPPSGSLLHRYPNGLQLLLVPNPSAPAVALELWVRVGSADEEPGQGGVSHLVEHMLFKGTRRRAAGEMAREIETVGGDINAYTSPDHTVFSAVVASRYTALALDALTDAVLAPLFLAEELERERAVVLDEIRSGEDLPQQHLAEQLFATAYPTHPYGRPVVGRASTVAALDRDACEGFHRRWYRPRTLTLVVAGELDPAALVAAVGRGLGSALPGPRRARPRRVREPAAGSFRSVLLARAVSEIYLELAFPGPAAAHPDAPAVDLLAAVLGQGEASRLQQRLKLEQNLVCGAGAASYAPLDPGLFQVSAVVESERLTDAYPALCEEVFRLCREPVGDDELERCRENLEADRIYQQETVEGQAQRAGFFHQLCGGPGAEAAYRAALRRVESTELRAVARRYLRPERAVLAGLHPADRPPPWTSAWVAEATCRAATVRRPRGGRLRPREVCLRRLDNGLRVVVKENPAVPLVAVRAAILGGQRGEPAARAGVCHLLSQALLCGTRRFSAADIARQVDALGGQLDGFAGRSSWGLRGEFLSRHRRAGLELFAEVLCQPRFPEEEVAWLRDDAQAALRLRKDDPAELAVRAFEQALYGKHPYGRDLLGSERTVAGLDVATLARLHPRVLRPESTVLAVVGDVDTEQVFAFCAEAFGGLTTVGAHLPAPVAPRRPARPVQVVNVANVAQAHLVLGFLGCRVDAPDRDALRVAGAMLSGQGGRLFRRLREAEGFGYAVELIGTEGVDPGYLAAQVTTAPERQEEARQVLLEEFAALAEGAFDAAEVAEAQRKLVGGFELALQENASQAAQLALDEVYGLGYGAYRHYPDTVFAVTPREVAEAASHYLAPGHHVAALLSPFAAD